MLSICQCRVRLGRTTLRHIVLHSEEKRSKYLLNLSHQSTRIYLNGFFFCSASNVELGDVICIIKRAIYKREQRRGKIGLRRYANNKASGEPTNPRSLTWSFAVCIFRRPIFARRGSRYFHKTDHAVNSEFTEI